MDIDLSSGTVTVTGSHGRAINATFEYVRPAFEQDSFALVVQENINIVDGEIASALDNTAVSSSEEPATIENHGKVLENNGDNNSPPVLTVSGDHVEVFWHLDSQYYSGENT